MHFLIIAQCLLAMGVSRPTQKFVQELLGLWLSVRGRFNFANLSRYSAWHERTLRRGFARGFEWAQFNSRLLTIIIPVHHELVAALDASFVKKSGRHTAGLGLFFNGCAGRVEKGLEWSLLSIVDVTANTAYALSAQQTIPGQATKAPGAKEAGTGAAAETRIDDYVRQGLRAPSQEPAFSAAAQGAPSGGRWLLHSPQICR